jgi:hypothetical protein
MKASNFLDAQKAFILKQGNDGVPVADICRKAGISQTTYFNWKKKYDGLRLRSRKKGQTMGRRSRSPASICYGFRELKAACFAAVLDNPQASLEDILHSTRSPRSSRYERRAY